MARSGGGEMLRFCALESCVDPSFWSELASRKLDQYKLSEAPVEVTGYLTASRHAEVPAQLLVMGSSFDGPGARSAQGSHALPGTLLNYNTAEGFARTDFKAQMRQAAARVWADIRSGAAEADPSLLCRFFVLAFGDLKKYLFTYWFAFPALKPPAPFERLGARPLAGWLGEEEVAQITDACDAWRGLSGSTLDATAPPTAAGGPAPFWLLQRDTANGWRPLPLSDWQAAGGADSASPGDTTSPGDVDSPLPGLVVAFSDPSSLPLTPGWPLRNVLLLAAARWGAKRISVVCVRDGARGRADGGRSFVVEALLPAVAQGWCSEEGDSPEGVGWEANAAGKLAPRRVDLSAAMSPTALAEQAVDLNLRLMRWRAAPGLDVPALAATRCLLLGAGTLGCAVARTLLAWGIRDITFVDSGRVAFSNPVRQGLFVFSDCLAGGRPKAEAAAEAVQKIFPSARAKGVQLSIPMPGHAPGDAAAEKAAVEGVRTLDQLVQDHDAVFLLTDSRESRWLPALLAAARRRIAITAALGFDGFVVMRHGAPPAASADGAGDGGSGGGEQSAGTPQQQQPSSGVTSQQQHQSAGVTSQQQETSATPQQQQASAGTPQQQQQQRPPQRLGCYFCNDVVAPANSAVDRTLDQQCTVARPGLAPIAGALSVELLAALLNHPLGIDAPAAGSGSSSGGGGYGAAAGGNASGSGSNASQGGLSSSSSAAAAAAAAAEKAAAEKADAAAALGPVPHMIRGQLHGFSQSVMEGRAFSQCTACSDSALAKWRADGPAFVIEAMRNPGVLEEVTGLAELHRRAAAMAEAAAASAAGAGGDGSGNGEEGEEEDWTEL